MNLEEKEKLSNEISKIETARELNAAERKISNWEREKELIEQDFILNNQLCQLENYLSSLIEIKVSNIPFRH